MRVNQESTGSRKQQALLMRVLKGFPRMKAKGNPRFSCASGLVNPDGARDKGLKDNVSKEKIKTGKAHDVLGNMRKILKGVLQFFF